VLTCQVSIQTIGWTICVMLMTPPLPPPCQLTLVRGQTAARRHRFRLGGPISPTRILTARSLLLCGLLRGPSSGSRAIAGGSVSDRLDEQQRGELSDDAGWNWMGQDQRGGETRGQFTHYTPGWNWMGQDLLIQGLLSQWLLTSHDLKDSMRRVSDVLEQQTFGVVT